MGFRFPDFTNWHLITKFTTKPYCHCLTVCVMFTRIWANIISMSLETYFLFIISYLNFLLNCDIAKFCEWDPLWLCTYVGSWESPWNTREQCENIHRGWNSCWVIFLEQQHCDCACNLDDTYITINLIDVNLTIYICFSVIFQVSKLCTVLLKATRAVLGSSVWDVLVPGVAQGVLIQVSLIPPPPPPKSPFSIFFKKLRWSDTTSCSQLETCCSTSTILSFRTVRL
jgi:hypothetical protein